MQRILVVDDERHVARVLRVALEGVGYMVETACNGEEAINKLLELKPDVLLTDIMMPRMNGRELVTVLRSRFPELKVPVIVMTSSLDHEHREWVKEFGELYFVEKPVSPRRIIQLLQKCLSPAESSVPDHETLQIV